MYSVQVLEIFKSDLNAQKIIILGDTILLSTSTGSCQILLEEGSQYIIYGGSDNLREDIPLPSDYDDDTSRRLLSTASFVPHAMSGMNMTMVDDRENVLEAEHSRRKLLDSNDDYDVDAWDTLGCCPGNSGCCGCVCKAFSSISSLPSTCAVGNDCCCDNPDAGAEEFEKPEGVIQP